MKLNKIVMVCAMCTFTLAGVAQTKVIAHRGYWDCEGSAQNSIVSLKKAAEAGVYGSEFDVQMTKDKELVVNLDDSIEGLLIGDTPYSQLKDLKLKNGETLPTLDDYLKAGKELPQVQLILEIKPHRTKAEEDEATSIIVRKVKEMQMEKQVEYISFSMNICEQLVKLTPESEIAYLKSDVAPKELKEKGMNGIDYFIMVMANKPEWIEEVHQQGMKVNVWTVNEPDHIRKMIDLKVDFVTTDHPVEALQLVNKK
ncbi:MAG: glycerophosphodiester phosphodiesterase [Bacteroides sp.]|nr:glycerophosphodiester phosphodiesterase [Bacteroides sp.]